LTKYAYSYNQNKTLCTRIRTASRKSTSVLLHLPKYWWAWSVFHDIFAGLYLVHWREQIAPYRRCILCWLLFIYAYKHSVVKPKFTVAEKESLICKEGKLRGIVVGQSSPNKVKQQIRLLFSLGMNGRYVLDCILQLEQCPYIPW